MRVTLLTPPAAGRIASTLLLALTLLGCSQRAPEAEVNRVLNSNRQPESTIVDFQQVACGHIWAYVDRAVMSNPLYWLRGIDCAVRLSPADARAQAKSWPADNWQSAFKQAILLNNGNVTPVERRQYLQRLDGYGYDYPSAVRPLLQLWRDGQGALLQQSEERTRYAHLQESSDAQLDALRQQQMTLNKELAVTRRKLDTLTDIERRLSSRRSPDASDTNHGPTKPGQDTSPVDTQPEDEATP